MDYFNEEDLNNYNNSNEDIYSNNLSSLNSSDGTLCPAEDKSGYKVGSYKVSKTKPEIFHINAPNILEKFKRRSSQNISLEL